VVRVAGHHHLKTIVTQAGREAARDLEHDIFFEEAVRAACSLVVAPVPGVDHDTIKPIGGGASRGLACGAGGGGSERE